MSVIALVISATLVLQVASQSDSYQLNGNNAPSFYEGDSGEVTCIIAPYPAIQVFGLFEGEGAAANAIDYCRIAKPPVGNEQITGHGILTNAECVKAVQALRSNPPVSIKIPIELTETAKYRCGVYNATNFRLNDVLINIDSLLVAPTNLQMTITPTPVYAGDEVTVTCTSEGGDPAASFKYTDDGEQKDNIDPFTATKDDNGKQITCKDQSHPNYSGGNSPMTSKSVTLEVYYFMATMAGVRYMRKNPVDSFELTCDIDYNIPDDATISYQWRINGVAVEDANNGVLIVKQDPDMNETISEVYECVAKPSDANLKEVVNTYNITWDAETTTPLAPPTTTAMKTTKGSGKDDNEPTADGVKDKGQTTTVIIIVVVVVTVIVLVIVIAVIVIKRRNSNSAEVTKDAGPTPPKTADPEQGNGEPEANEPMLKPSERGEGKADDSGKP